VVGAEREKMKYIPYKELGDFRVGDIIDFGGVLGMLAEKFDWTEGTRQCPDFAWRVTTINPNEHIDNRYYAGDRYGISVTNLYNIWKGKVVARGPEK
tara:strand:+ start:1093 stop:1383 length:291 start_codon:yes stop_codon:yes gene_type:complete